MSSASLKELRKRTASGLTIAQQAVRDGYAAGKGPSQIAKEVGMKPHSVSVIANRFGWKRVKQVKPQKPAERYRFAFAGKDRNELPWGGPSITGALRT